MRITKVYTRTGDKGNTSLADGTLISKDDMRIEAFGTVDELNAVVGLCVDFLDNLKQDAFEPQFLNAKYFLGTILECIQQDLFNVGGDLATPVENRFAGMVFVSEREASALEHVIDQMNALLSPLKDFVLPAGSGVCAAFHLARTVCRRAERNTVRMSKTVSINEEIIKFLNRLSDFFFVASRYIQAALQKPEVIWKKSGGLAHFKLTAEFIAPSQK